MSKGTISSEHSTRRGSLQAYIIGFTLSVGLTLIPYILVVNQSFNRRTLVAVLMAFAALQLLVQLQFFIHLGQESKPRWHLMSFMFTLLILLIVVIGSLWIMANLDYHSMPPQETERYIQDEEAIHR